MVRKVKIVIAQPLLQRGPSEVFRIVDVDDTLSTPTKLCHGIDSCFTVARLRPQWAVTPKLTMIAGRQLSIGAFPVWNALLDLTIA